MASADPRLEKLKAEALQMVEARSKQVQEIVDMLFSFQELGFQEFETQKYLTTLLQKEGFTVEKGVAGIPSSWTAKWSYGTGKPEISLGSDVDGIPQASSKPGVGYKDPMIQGGPGHGEGHNSGQAVNIVASIVVKQLMQRDKINGTILLWPGVAEEQMAGKAFLVRAGLFKNTDVTLFTRVGNDLGVSGAQWFQRAHLAEFKVRGKRAAAGAPWRGKSPRCRDLLTQGWEFRRSTCGCSSARTTSSAMVAISRTSCPAPRASGSISANKITRARWALRDRQRIAAGAAMMTDTKLDTVNILGSAGRRISASPSPKPCIRTWSGSACPSGTTRTRHSPRDCRELGSPDFGLSEQVNTQLRGAPTPVNWTGGGSDDIGDVAWNMPRSRCGIRQYSGPPGTQLGQRHLHGHAHRSQGALAGAKVQALTMLDIFMTPKVVSDAWDYFNNVQTKDVKYQPFIRPFDQPPTYLNADIMARFREQQKKFYYDPTKFKTYLEQLGIEYPTVRPQETKPRGDN